MAAKYRGNKEGRKIQSKKRRNKNTEKYNKDETYRERKKGRKISRKKGRKKKKEKKRWIGGPSKRSV